MKRPFIYCALAGTFIALLTSCSHVYYAPSGQNVPLMKEQGELQLSAGTAGSGEGGGANVMAAYAPGKNIGVTLNSYIATGSNDGSGADGHGYIIEGGVGYFKPFANDKLVFETYAGLGVVAYATTMLIIPVAMCSLYALLYSLPLAFLLIMLILP
ncbi:MAG: hypothetical protein M0D57_14665 [Sphingobacteriales bacterium JAD_PAG50586_3]|nr:MAG: hypothetical protein M0D57_14665 [Sphingobacteriales bacterium JAD_PAG50586_3]